jgi:hypothetical protein
MTTDLRKNMMDVIQGIVQARKKTFEATIPSSGRFSVLVSGPSP